MANEKILIADDDKNICELLRLYLAKEGYETVIANDGEAAVAAFEKEKPNMVLLDVMMPKMDGWEVCRRIRACSSVPVIMLTARGQEEDELHGFSLGADEYIAKPFSLKILLARVEAVLRRRGEAAPAVEPTALEESAPAPSSGVSIDRMGRELRVDGRPVELTYTEYELLLYLTDNPGVALSRDRILDNVWRYGYEGDARTVDTHVKKLRSKLGPYGDRIKTVRGVGYKYEGERP